MTKGRLEAFSDGVIAIIITIMVLELHVPAGRDLAALFPLATKFLCYAFSFLTLGIYWCNHHHLSQTIKHVDGRVLWANLHLLFWLSLFPLVTDWMGESTFAAWPVALYGLVLLCAGIAYFLLTRVLLSVHGKDSVLSAAVGRDRKGVISVVTYAVAVPVSFFEPLLAFGLYFIVAVVWLIPDRRIEHALARL